MNYDGTVFCSQNQSGFGLVQSKWPMLDITWTIAASLPQFPRESFKKAVDEAWARWQRICGIRPHFVDSNQANLTIGLQNQGPGQVLADCELPINANPQTRLRMRIDTQEAWVISDNPPSNRIDLIRVLCHELGHGLGSQHLNGRNLMAPTYSSAIKEPQTEDIAEMVARYGMPAPEPVPPAPPPSPSEYTELIALLAKGGQFYVRRNGVIARL